MDEYPKIRGKNQTQRNASIEHALKSLAKRVTKKATVYIPPIPLFMFCYTVELDNTIGRVIVPFSGTMKDLYIRTEEMQTKKVLIALNIISDVATTTLNFVLSEKSEKLDLEMEIDAGTLLQVVLEDGKFAGMSLGTAIYPEMDSHKAKKYLLEEILEQKKEIE